MPSKYYLRNFKPDHYYHIYNRGAYKNDIYKDQQDYQVFTSILSYYLLSPQAKHYLYKNTVKNPYIKVRNLMLGSVNLISYCLMPNHLHLLMKETSLATKQTGISNLMRRVMIAYSMYFQNKYKHSGALFQGRYKTVEVTSGPQLLHLSRYIHLNPKKLLAKNQKLSDYPYSSYPVYIGKKSSPWLNSQEILSEFNASPTNKYIDFVESQTPDSDILTDLTLE